MKDNINRGTTRPRVGAAVRDPCSLCGWLAILWAARLNLSGNVRRFTLEDRTPTEVLHDQTEDSLCDVLGIEHPIIQAGMGWDSRGSTTPPRLVAAVSNAGGLGVIGGSPLQPEFIRERIRATRELTDRPFGVDITLPRLAQTPYADVGNVREFLERTHPDHVSFVHDAIEEFGLETQGPDPWSKVKTPDMVQRQLDVILEEGVRVLAVGLGDTAEVVPLARERGMKVLALCGNVKQAVGHAANGVDVVIAQGYEAGGHTGRIANFPLIPQVVDAVRPTPVVVAGGIADGRGLAAALSLGAVGVWCGTVFLASAESEIHADYKSQLIQGRTEDFVLDRFPSGKPSRHYRSPVIRKWEASGLQPWRCRSRGCSTTSSGCPRRAASGWT